MKTIFILVLFIGGGHTRSPISMEFQDEATCAAVLEALGARYLPDRFATPSVIMSDTDRINWEHSSCMPVEVKS